MLYEFITSNKQELIGRARALVKARKWPTVSADKLENGLPMFLTQLAETLRLKYTADPFSPTAIGVTAGQHGADLVAKGFTVAQVVHDYGDICQAITQAAVEKKAAITAQEFETLNLCLDNAIAGAVTKFNLRREDTLDRHDDLPSSPTGPGWTASATWWCTPHTPRRTGGPTLHSS
jgi:hypothetical protein